MSYEQMVDLHFSGETGGEIQEEKLQLTIEETAKTLSHSAFVSMKSLRSRKPFRNGEGQMIKPVFADMFTRELEDYKSLEAAGLLTISDLTENSFVVKATEFGATFYAISEYELNEIEFDTMGL